MATGVVETIGPLGVVFIQDRVTGQRFGFTPNKVVNYKGEALKDIGIQPGRVVEFATDGDRIVSVTRPSTR